MIPSSVFAKTVITGHTVIPEAHQEVRYLRTTVTKWTKFKYVTDAWTKLEKGDALFYVYGSGNAVTLSVSAGYHGATFGVSVPLGHTNFSGGGVIKRIKKDGKYKLKAKKLVQLTVVQSQIRNLDVTNKKPVSKWKNCMLCSRKCKDKERIPELVRKK